MTSEKLAAAEGKRRLQEEHDRLFANGQALKGRLDGFRRRMFLVNKIVIFGVIVLTLYSVSNYNTVHIPYLYVVGSGIGIVVLLGLISEAMSLKLWFMQRKVKKLRKQLGQ